MQINADFHSLKHQQTGRKYNVNDVKRMRGDKNLSRHLSLKILNFTNTMLAEARSRYGPVEIKHPLSSLTTFFLCTKLYNI